MDREFCISATFWWSLRGTCTVNRTDRFSAHARHTKKDDREIRAVCHLVVTLCEGSADCGFCLQIQSVLGGFFLLLKNGHFVDLVTRPYHCQGATYNKEETSFASFTGKMSETKELQCVCPMKLDLVGKDGD